MQELISSCPSVCPSHSGIVSKRTPLHHYYFTNGEFADSSFLPDPIHREIQNGSPRAKALNETGAATNWRILDL